MEYEFVFSERLNAPWSFSQGLTVLLVAMGSLTLLSMGHMYWVKQSIGFEAYLGDGPRLPPRLLITSQLIKAFALTSAIWIFALKLRGLGWRAVGFRTVHWRWYVFAVLAAMLGLCLNIVLAKLIIVAAPDWAPFTASRYGVNDGPLWQILALIFLTVLVTPVVEEVFFRGFLFQWMATHRPIWLAVMVSSIMFGASHIIPPQIIAASAFSLLIIYLFLASRSVLPAIVCHAVNNALGLGMNMAAVSGELPAFLTPPG